MIRAIDYQKVDMCDQEWEYYQELVKKFTSDKESGTIFFKDLFLTDEKGIITIVKPTKPIPYEVLFFAINLQQNQHLREYDARIEAVEKLVKESK